MLISCLFSSLTQIFPLFFARRAHYAVHATRSPCCKRKKTSLTTHHANAVLAMAHRHSLHWPLCAVLCCVYTRCLHSILILFFTFPVALRCPSRPFRYHRSLTLCLKQFAHRMILHNFDLSYVIKHMVRKQMSCFRCHNHRAACFQWIRWSPYRSKNSLLNHYRSVLIRIKDEYHLRHDGSPLFSEDAIQH